MSNKSQQMSYLRIGNTAISWFFTIKSPFKLVCIWSLAEVLSIIDLVTDDHKSLTPQTDSMLRYVADIMWTTLLMFSSLQASLSDSPPSTDNSQAQLNQLSFQIGLMFLVLFTSRWFKIYSINLVGERRDKAGTQLETSICDFANAKYIDRLLHIATNLWCLSKYFGVISLTDSGIKQLAGQVGLYALPLVFVRFLVLVIELRMACVRIIDLDVEERKQKVVDEDKSQKTPVSSKKGTAPKSKTK